MLKEISPNRLSVFDNSLYISLPEKKRATTIGEDLAGIVIEAGDMPLHMRINPRRLEIVDGRVIDPKTGGGVIEEFSTKNEFARRETEGAKNFYNLLAAGENGTLVIQESPSGGPYDYKEARINVGLRVGNTIEFYGIPSNLTPEGLLNHAFRLSEWSNQPFKPQFSEDLRELAIAVSIPTNTSPWLFLNQVAPLDSNAWTEIFKGTPWKIKAKAERDAAWVAAEMAARLSNAATNREIIVIGAWGEKAMQSMGWKLNPLACPGLFNTQLLNLSSSYEFSSGGFTIDTFGNFRITGWAYHPGECVNPACTDKGSTVEVGPCKICKKCEKIL